jgi:hypothetical protein
MLILSSPTEKETEQEEHRIPFSRPDPVSAPTATGETCSGSAQEKEN